ncbi:alpha/beta hydrolase [Chitinimonas koreensis]|uniref:alpha/beta hydrolase n=1 Tax=Chitinimonas koreensis TaxID=356302 RepID=UPI00041A2857|nr:alpha/beta hydrolase [Chitinimonas koreensis]QNM97999.1 alpha/beta hydrolase [Chitinimonas koreensis]
MNALSKTFAAAVLSLALGQALAAGSPGVERRTQGFLDALAAAGGPPLETLAPKDARAVLVGAQAGTKVALAPAKVERKTVEQDGRKVALTVVRPQAARGLTPAFMFIHGGGWILGDYPTHERLVRDLVDASGATAVFVEYTPSPEARYPAAIEEIYAATRWVAGHGREIGVDGSRLAVAGNSVGGNMSAALTLLAKERGGPKLRFQLLLWPVTDARFDTESYTRFADGHFLSRDMMKWFWDAYTTDAAERADRHASPLQASTAQLAGLPPALIQTAEFDVLRDEAEAYGRKLDAAGVDVTVTRYNGMIHDFGLLNALSQVPATRAALRQAGVELKRHLQ